MLTSLLKTLAGKYDSSVSKMARKYAATIETPHGPRKCLQVSVERGEGTQATGRNVRWYPAQAAEERGPDRPRTSPATAPRQRADPSAPGGTVRDLREADEGAGAPDPQARRPRQARTARPTRMDADSWPSDDARPSWSARACHANIHHRRPTALHGIVTGEPGDRKRSRRVREGGVGKGPARAPRRRRTSASTAAQLERNHESRARQYSLRDRAIELGWPAATVSVVDEDLGRSGASTDERLGFKDLVAEVGLGHVGLMLALEVSRFARSSADWHQLLDLCALTGR